MAKRTKLAAPTAAELAALDADFRSEKPARPNPATAPIAQVAAETAALGTGEAAQDKLNRLDAERLKAAETKGLLIAEIPTDQIDADAMIRDRSGLDAAEMEELKISIRANGVRLPIEVYPGEGGRYALLSGYRRLEAVRSLAKINGGAEFVTIKAIVRPAKTTAASFAAMVEENEIRSNLSHYERGRIAVVSAQQGAFENTEAAIAALFGHASAAKRSKVKSFAEIFEVLGDMLKFPEALTERRGLRLSGALRQGAEKRLREVLEPGQGTTADLEWAVLEQVIAEVESGPVKVAKLGRPKAVPPTGWKNNDTLHLSSGVVLRKEVTKDGYAITFSGTPVPADLIDRAMEQLARAFEKPR